MGVFSMAAQTAADELYTEQPGFPRMVHHNTNFQAKGIPSSFYLPDGTQNCSLPTLQIDGLRPIACRRHKPDRSERTVTFEVSKNDSNTAPSKEAEELEKILEQQREKTRHRVADRAAEVEKDYWKMRDDEASIEKANRRLSFSRGLREAKKYRSEQTPGGFRVVPHYTAYLLSLVETSMRKMASLFRSDGKMRQMKLRLAGTFN